MPRYSFVPFSRQWSKGGTFSFRLQLPEDVFTTMVASGTRNVRRTVTFSLKTRDPVVARSRALRAAADVGDLIAAVRSGRAIEKFGFETSLYQRDGFALSHSVAAPSIRNPERKPDAGRPSAKMMTLRRAYEEVYLPRRSERKGALPRRRSRLDIEKAITRFTAMLGDKPIANITRQDAERFVRDVSVGSVATKKKTITSLSMICNAAVAANLIAINPFRGLGPDRATITEARRSYQRFDLDQLTKFFDRTEREDGAVLWLPRLLLFTGARLEEMAQLRSSWIVRRDGVDVIDLHEARVKNGHNRRYVPIHQNLLALGFLAFARRADDRLFPELRYRASAERWSGSISTRLNREIDMALGADRRLTVHSLRKTFEHACYVVGIPKPTINAITGHKPNDISEEHYLMLKDDLPLLKAHIDRLAFPIFKSGAVV
jgi:integrase